ncbi:type III-B CRISPR module RAMP protein Cmr1 [uncultured Thiodictyon sp.]|uniref:type III-B CRISPR module RAMP protein Cmr1 n=1 Tax=uncultured Thiodictyon sp. TaxID=1846217 RepID=UPI0025E3D99F|nr:type III-B CRISPR module RAMP protein Cmr1 [uncultured Thiodictyon sp.]
MRKPNQAAPLDAARAAWAAGGGQSDGHTWRTLPCKLVTPLYGGGVRPGQVDETLPVRVAGIRGQLRYWWRIACGPIPTSAALTQGESEAMFQREVAIWGGIASTGPTTSKVAVRVDKVVGMNVAPAFVYTPNHKKAGEFRTMPEVAGWAEGYALFPAQGKLTPDKRHQEIPPHRLALANLGFSLRLRLHPDLTETERHEIETALRWWASFGGVGARTRRGLGAVKVEGLAPVTETEVADRGGRLLLRAADTTSDHAWKMSVGRLKDFRQKLDLGRNLPAPGSQSPAGRSRWPEADEIRRQTGRHAPKHTPKDGVDGVYPRAAFGLPIVFHFKDENIGDPSQQLLVPAGLDRMASPLILRPYWNGRQWHPAALLLPGWEQALRVRVDFGTGPSQPAWPADPSERRTLADQIKPMQGRGTDPLTAFMDYFEKG